MVIFRSCLVFSSHLKAFYETCFLLPQFEKEKDGFMQTTLTAKSCGVPFDTDAGTSDAEGFYLEVDE